MKEDANDSAKGVSNMSLPYLIDLAMVLDMNHICGSTISFTDRFVKNSSATHSFKPFREWIAGILPEVEQYVDPILTLKEVQYDQ